LLLRQSSLLDAGGGAVGVAVLPAGLAEPLEAWLARHLGAVAEACTASGLGPAAPAVSAARTVVDAAAAAAGLAVLVVEGGQALVAVRTAAVLAAFRGNGDGARRAAVRATVAA
jgi:hypothetical protein